MLHQLGQPLSLAIALIVVGTALFWRRRRTAATACIAIGVGGLYLLATPAVSDLLVQSLERGYEPKPAAEYRKADAIVILGGGILPPVPPQQASNLTDAADRIPAGARLYHADKAPLVITTGARPYGDIGPSAAEAAAEMLRDLGVPAEAVVAPGTSTSTYEDALAVRALGARKDLDSVLLVTSAMHIPRAVAAFEAAGINAHPAPTDYLSVDVPDRDTWRWLPDAGAFDRANKAWHEYAALTYYRVRGWI